MRIVRRVFEEVFDKRNLDMVDELFAADYVFHSPGNPDLNSAGGRTRVRGLSRCLPRLADDHRRLFAAGDGVASRYRRGVSSKVSHGGSRNGEAGHKHLNHYPPPGGREVVKLGVE